jgi:hypothetical protein
MIELTVTAFANISFQDDLGLKPQPPTRCSGATASTRPRRGSTT